MARMLIALCLLLVGCGDDAGQLECRTADGQVVRCPDADPKPVSLRFDDAPSCPAPSTPRADSYVDHGGASHALSWYLLMHSLSQPTYRETHVVHHYAPRPVYVTRPAPSGRGWVASTPTSSYARPTPTTYVAPRPAPVPVVVKPASGWTWRSTSSGTKMAPSPSTSAPKSAGYGYSTKPSGATVRPSAPAPRPSTPAPSFRSSPSTSSFRSSGSSFGGSRRGN
ncbi:MAG TPA: hypothetical protein VFX31_01645 [Ktedonobacterales bacterium]|nr:hypothetical protein [Ktedonobacterales bacterium]